MSIQKVLRTVYHYFVTEQRSRNASSNKLQPAWCVYDGEGPGGNGVGCAVGCCLTHRQAKRVDESIGGLYYNSVSPEQTEHIYNPLGLENTPQNRDILCSLQRVHDYSGSFDKRTLAERMKETILDICKKYEIPETILTDGGEMYTK